MTYPDPDQIEAADHEQLARWHRFLPSPGMSALGRSDFGETLKREADTMGTINSRLLALGGITPEISKAIGW